jgi:hypothetical protein
VARALLRVAAVIAAVTSFTALVSPGLADDLSDAVVPLPVSAAIAQ